MKTGRLFFSLFFLFALINWISGEDLPERNFSRADTILDFDTGTIELYSYPGEDNDPLAWELDAEDTYLNSDYSLELSGNTWKICFIDPVTLSADDVWQVAMKVVFKGEIHGFGIGDGENELFYSLDGTQMLDIEEWIPVYQGAFPENQWNRFQLPVANDWEAWYEYLPEIDRLFFINDCDSGPTGICLFDYLIDISDEILENPQVTFSYGIQGDVYGGGGDRNVTIGFRSEIINPLPDDYTYLWNFGDGTTSDLQNPLHVYEINSDYPYTVLLQVRDEKGFYGHVSRKIIIPDGTNSLPVTLNFVGDVMLARGYEETGGIIQTQGVEAIFEPTLDILGDAASITVANLECPLTEHTEHHPTKTIYFKGNPENVQGLVYAGIDIVTLANNHILDYNYPGLAETQQVLTENGIMNSGVGIDSYEAYEPLFYSHSGLTFAFLASSDRTGQYNNYQPYLQAGFNKPGFAYMTPYYLSGQITEVRETADLVIVEMHAGSEYSSEPGSNYDLIDPDEMYPEEEYNPDIDIPHMWDLEIRRHAVDSGADLVVVHHPHIIQGLELYHGKMIVHSLGNFVFDLNYTETMPSMILNVEADLDGFSNFVITPVFIDDWIPQRAEGELGLHILDYLARRSQELNTILSVDRNTITARVIMDTLNPVSYDEFFTENVSLINEPGYMTSAPVSLSRWGNISRLNSINPPVNWEYRLGRETVWFGNFEDEGCTLWNINSNDEWYDENEFYAGERSLGQRRYFNSGNIVTTNLEKKLRRYADNYTLHGFIKTENGTDVTIEIRYYQSRNSTVPVGSENIGSLISGTNNWNFYAKQLTPPDNGYYFDIHCSSDCPPTGTALSWFDNVGLIEWTDWQGYTPDLEIDNPNDFYYLQIRTNSSSSIAQINYTETSYGSADAISYTAAEDKLNPAFKLLGNHPNPFNPSGTERNHETTIEFSLIRPTLIELTVYNIKGQTVKHLLRENLQRGDYQFIWNGTDDNNRTVSSGIYFISLSDSRNRDVRKCLLLK